MCLFDMLLVKIYVTPLILKMRWNQLLFPLRDLLVTKLKMQKFIGYIKLYHIAIFNNSKRTPNGSLWRYMQDHGSKSGPAHTPVGNPKHICYAFLEQFFWQCHVANFRHAGISFRTHI